MTVLLYLIPIALGLGLAGLCAFLWSLRTGQYDDLDGAALRVLADDDLGETSPEVGADRAAVVPHAAQSVLLRQKSNRCS